MESSADAQCFEDNFHIFNKQQLFNEPFGDEFKAWLLPCEATGAARSAIVPCISRFSELTTAVAAGQALSSYFKLALEACELLVARTEDKLLFVLGGLGLALHLDGFVPMGIKCAGVVAKKVANAGFISIDELKLQVARVR